MLEAKDRNARGHGQRPRTQRANVFQKKKVFINLPQGFWHVFQDEEKKSHDLGPFLKIRK